LRYIDLHTHSTFSDGATSPTNLIREAKEAGLCAISLTDHDTMAGVTEAIVAGELADIEVIPGVELSASNEGRTVHILGYGLDQFNPDLRALLAELQQIREERNGKILEKLAKQGIKIDRDELLASSSGLIGRPHIARILVKYKIVNSFELAFRKYLKKDGLAYAEAKLFTATEIIRRIKNAGGLAVLAHPTTFDRSLLRITATVKYLRTQGLDGIEAIYPGHTQKIGKSLVTLAKNLNLLITGGSDFHGTIKNGISIGGAPVMPPIPYRYLEEMKEGLAIVNQKKQNHPIFPYPRH
jgi:hypothetical protein